MSRWKTYTTLAVDAEAFCAYGIHKRMQPPPLRSARYELWGVVRGGGGHVVLDVHDQVTDAIAQLNQLVEAATGKGD